MRGRSAARRAERGQYMDNLPALCYKLGNAWGMGSGRRVRLCEPSPHLGICNRHNRPAVHRLLVQVRDNNVDQALRALKKKMQREGLYREMRMRRHYEKPSEKRAREKAEAVRRYRKLLRKRRERDEL